jgi:hypothetical protein
MPGFPEWGTVSMIEPSPFDANTAYVVVDAHRLDDMRPYLYATTDLGQTWKRLGGELAPNVYLHAVREDRRSADSYSAPTPATSTSRRTMGRRGSRCS